ncbi:hypothetical protein M8J76_002294 [Diaphorina citri]|nr:hypothetical protein M8J76_002294 [Diaphorina citri]KAI5756261.1 hypothetical protein M8J77_023484 [Diaphorina citri]
MNTGQESYLNQSFEKDNEQNDTFVVSDPLNIGEVKHQLICQDVNKDNLNDNINSGTLDGIPLLEPNHKKHVSMILENGSKMHHSNVLKRDISLEPVDGIKSCNNEPDQENICNNKTDQENFDKSQVVDEALLLGNDMICVKMTDPPSFLMTAADGSSFLLRKTTLHFLIYALGICCSYLLSGVFSEQLLKGSYGTHAEHFSYIFIFVFVQVIVNYTYAHVLLCTVFKKDEDTTATKYYAITAFCTFMSMFLANKSLAWISYPTQVLGKSIKPIPVMIFSVIFGKQRYSLKKYCFVILVVVGVSMFMITKPSKDLKSTHISFGWGELCVTVSLIFDGIIGALQERMRHDFQTQPGFFMMNINKWSILYLGIAMCISEEVLDFFKFIQENPVALYYLSIITVCCAIGQTFIYLMISHFGTLSCTIVTTTRKFFTILGSIIIFRHSMTPLQWVATCLVFLGLLLDTYYSNRECNEKSNRNSTCTPA